MLDTTMDTTPQPQHDIGANTSACRSDARENAAFDALMAMPETIEALPMLPGCCTLDPRGIEMHTVSITSQV